MKSIFTFLALIFYGTLFLSAQTVQPTDLPLAVQSNFKARFPDASKIKWTKEKDIYAAEFVNKEMNTEAEFTEKGEWKKTSWEIPVEFTPLSITTYVKTNYPKYKIKDVDLEEAYPSIDKLYAVEIAKKKELITLYFKVSGEFVKTDPEKKEDDPKK
jgi:hypothetical protein